MFKQSIPTTNLINIQAVGSERQKNVQFAADTHSWHYEVPAERDSTFAVADTTDTIQDFMNRPVLVATGELPIGQDYNIEFNPWKLFFENERVFEKLKNFRNLRCDLKIKLVVNGNPFYYGSYIMYYHPLHTFDTRTSNNNSLQGIIQYSQMPHVYIDPCEGTGGEITIPYFYNKDAMNIVEREWNDMGKVVIRTIFPLQHSNDNTEPIDISVFVMAQNVSISTPTSRTPVENQADEYGKPSMVAHSIAKAAGWFGEIPIIGKYARATQMIMTTFGEAASMFGYSRPRQVLEATSVRQRPAGNLAVVNIPDNIGSLALDAKKEVTIDPRVVGLQSSDEMAIQPIAMRESFVTLFPWSESVASEQHLFSIRVNPIQGDLTTTGDHYITPSAFTSLPFRYWRGTMRFRFNIIASKYHRGRLKFVWDPEFSGAQSGNNYNSNYITIVDINQQKDITLDIGWGSNFSYLETGALTLPKFSTTPFTSSSRWANGTLSVFVVNSLTSPGPTNSDVAVSVFSSMCDDYEVACPDSVFLDGELSVRSSPIPPPVDRPPIDGDDGTGPQPPPPPTNPTEPQLPPPDPEEGEEIVIPDGIGFGNSRFWPNPSIPQGVPIKRIDGQADLPSGATGTIFVVPPFISTGFVNVYSQEAINLSIQHLDENLNVLTTQLYAMPADTITSMVLTSLADESLFQQKYHYIKIFGEAEEDLLRLVDLEIGGVLFRRFTAEQMNARLSSGGTPTYDANGFFTFNFLNTADKLLLDVPAGLTSAGNSPIIHYMMVGVGGVVHRYNGRNRAPGASATFKFAIGEQLVYDSPGVMALGVAPVAIPVLGEFTFEGALLMYYPSVEPQAILVEDQSEETISTDHAAEPVASSADEQMAPSLPGMEVNSIYFGEQVTSWRQVLKRYETIGTFVGASPKIRWHDSFTELATGAGLDVRRLSMVDYVKSAYVGARGGMRLKILPLGDPSSAGTIVISNVSDSNRDDDALTLPNWAGSVFEPIALTGAADVEVPYYSNLRFFHARLSAGEYSGSSGRSPRQGLQRLEADISLYTSNVSARFALTHAIAEDYSLHFFLSAPVLNFQPPPVVNPPFG